MREIKDLKDLKFDKKNYRTHDAENQILIKKSITEVGLGAELDPRYCDVILMRWEALTGKEALKCQDPT